MISLLMADSFYSGEESGIQSPFLGEPLWVPSGGPKDFF